MAKPCKRDRRNRCAMIVAGVGLATAMLMSAQRSNAIAVFDSASLAELGAMVSTMGQQLQQMQSLVTSSEDLLDAMGELGDVSRMQNTLNNIRDDTLASFRQPKANGDNGNGPSADPAENPNVINFLNEPGSEDDDDPGGPGEGPTLTRGEWQNGISGEDPYPETEVGELAAHREWLLRNWFIAPESRGRTGVVDGIARWRAYVTTSLAAEGFAAASQAQARAEAAAEGGNAYMEALEESDSIRGDLQVQTYTTQGAVDAQWEANRLAGVLMQMEATSVLNNMPAGLTDAEYCLLFGQEC